MRPKLIQDQFPDFIARCNFDISKLYSIVRSLVNEHSEYICDTCPHKKRSYPDEEWKLCDFNMEDIEILFYPQFLVAPARCSIYMKNRYNLA